MGRKKLMTSVGNINNRIRYVKKPDGSWESLRYIRSEDYREYKVYIDKEGKTGRIIGFGSEAYELTATSSHKIKIKIKEVLTKLKCKFNREIRKLRISRI